jgi:hypothetical protein
VLSGGGWRATAGVRGRAKSAASGRERRTQGSVAPVRRSSPPEGWRASEARLKLEGRRQPSPPPEPRAPRGVRSGGVERDLRCSCCRSVAEVGERHLPRVAGGARKGFADRVGQHGSAAPVTRSAIRSGQQGCLASKREPNSERVRAWLGSNVGHHADGRRSGSNGPRRSNTAAREQALARQGWSGLRRKSGARLRERRGGSPGTAMLCDRERQRSRRSVLLSQPKGAEGV